MTLKENRYDKQRNIWTLPNKTKRSCKC